MRVSRRVLSAAFLMLWCLGPVREGSAGLLLFSYKNVNLLGTPRVMGPRHTLKERTVFCANISAELNRYLFDGSLSIREKLKTFDKMKYEIFIADTDGDRQKRLTESGEGVLSFAPRFTRDGSHIIYKGIYKTEDYVSRYPDEQFTNIPHSPKLYYTSEYAVVSGPFTINYFRYSLSEDSQERITVAEADKFYSSQKK